MKRLTLPDNNRTDGNIWLLKDGIPHELVTETDDRYEYFKKLAEYENLEQSGKLVSCEFKNILCDTDGEHAECSGEENKKVSFPARTSLAHKEVPFSLGDTLYTVSRGKIVKLNVFSVETLLFGDGIVSTIFKCTEDDSYSILNYPIEEIGKTVFLTEEDAENSSDTACV